MTRCGLGWVTVDFRPMMDGWRRRFEFGREKQAMDLIRSVVWAERRAPSRRTARGILNYRYRPRVDDACMRECDDPSTYASIFFSFCSTPCRHPDGAGSLADVSS